MKALGNVVSSGRHNLLNLGEDLRVILAEAFRRHIDFFHEDWRPRGLFLRVPFTPLSIWLEWSEVSFGWGYETTSRRDWEIYLGRLKVVVSFA